MKKAFLYGALLLCCALFVVAENEEKRSTQDAEKKSPIEIVKQPYGCIVQEPVSLSLLTKGSLYFVPTKKDDKKYGIVRYAARPIGITPQQVMLDHKPKQQNPLYDDTIDFIAANYDENLYIIGHKDPATLYLFTAAHNEDHVTMLSARDIHDAQGKTTAGIVAFAQGLVFDEKGKTPYAFLSVKRHEGPFGEPGSGIALVRYDPDIKEEKKDKKNKQDKKEEETSKPYLDILDANKGISKANVAYAIDFQIGPLSINGGLEKIDYDVIDMHWDETLQRCYIAVRAKTKDTAQDDQGVCALLVGRVSNKKLFFEPVAPHEALRGEAIIGATGPGKYVSLHKVRTMKLNNSLSYLVVVGGNGTVQETNQKVYAFPLVNLQAQTSNLYNENQSLNRIHGTIAKNNNSFVATFSNGVIQARVFDRQVTDKNDFYTSSDMCVQVGGSALLPGPIHTLATRGDCVIVGTRENGNGKTAGVFYSQAILNQIGAVVAWTNWQLVPGGDKKILQVLPGRGEFRFLYTAGPEQFLHVQTTAWSTPHNVKNGIPLNNIQAYVESQFSSGLSGITNYPSTMPGISGQNSFSFLVAMGIAKVIIMQTSECDEDGNEHPFYGAYETKFELENGSLAGISAVQDFRSLSISGGVLSTCGALTCSAIGVQNDQAWFFVGGSGGVAVLTAKDGSGWDAQSGLGNGFKALRDDFAFKSIGNYKFVRKLIYCDNYLYILTNSSLDRIALSQEQFENTKTCKVEHLIDSQEKKIFLNDIIISPHLLLLATSQGLCSAVPASSLKLHKITLPCEHPVTSFFVVSRSGHENDFAYTGQVYVLARSHNYRETFVYRLLVDIQHGYQNAIRVIPDCYKKDELSYWIRYAAPQQGFVTDGISLYSYCSGLKNRNPHVSLISSSEFRNRNIIKTSQITQLPLMFENEYAAIRTMIRNSASGSWLVAGDFGLRVNM